jgi:hypothetical protein
LILVVVDDRSGPAGLWWAPPACERKEQRW